MMKKMFIVGTALALTAMLLFSCNKNRFDFSELNSVEGSGQWKLPIGNAHVTLGQLMTQLGDNQFVSYDDDGNLMVSYHQTLNRVLKGSDFLSLGSFNFHTENTFPNPFPGYVLPDPIDTVFRFSQKIELSADSAGIESAIIKSGELTLTFVTNLGHVSDIVFSSSGIVESNGDSLVRHFNSVNGNTVDLSGATFHLHDPVTGVADSTLTLNYAIYYQLTGIDDPEYTIESIIALNRLKIQELSGYIDSFTYEIDYDTSFSLPLNNIEGQVKLVGAEIKINERNTFENLYATLLVDEAELYGGGATPFAIFGDDPYAIQIIPSVEFVNILPEESLDLQFDTRYDAVRVHGIVDFNPSHVENLVIIRDTSAIDLQIDAMIPMKFNVPGVYYLDTIELSMSDIQVPELLEKIQLDLQFDSEFPFNLNGQLYTLDPRTGRITDSLLTNPMHIEGSFDGAPVYSSVVIDVTHSRLDHLMKSGRLMMRFGVDTDEHDVWLNLDNGLGITIKADVIYGGTIEINNY